VGAFQYLQQHEGFESPMLASRGDSEQFWLYDQAQAELCLDIAQGKRTLNFEGDFALTAGHDKHPDVPAAEYLEAVRPLLSLPEALRREAIHEVSKRSDSLSDLKEHVALLDEVKTSRPGASMFLLDPKEVANGPWKVGFYREMAELSGIYSITLFEQRLKSKLAPELADADLLAPLRDGKDRAPVDLEDYLKRFIGLPPVGGLTLGGSADVAVELVKAYGEKGFEHYQTLSERKLDLSQLPLKLDGRPFDRLLAELEVHQIAGGSSGGGVKVAPGAVQVGGSRLKTRS
jgi:hypothetical protein